MTTKKNTFEKVADLICWSAIGALIIYSLARIMYSLFH